MEHFVLFLRLYKQFNLQESSVDCGSRLIDRSFINDIVINQFQMRCI